MIQPFNPDKYIDSLLASDGKQLEPTEQRVLAKLKAVDAEVPRVQKRLEQLEQEKARLIARANQLSGQGQALSAVLIEAESDRQPVVALGDVAAGATEPAT